MTNLEQRASKKTLSITLNSNLYQKLQNEVGKGKISQFVEETISDRLNQQEQSLENAYREISQDKNRWQLTQEWQTAALSDLRKKTK